MRRAAAVFAIAFAITAAFAWQLFPHFRTVLPSDAGDPALNTWILWWNTRAVPLTAAWWNAPIFFPVAGAFALTESLLALTPITTPVIWLTGSPIAAYNVSFLLSTPMAALGGYALGYVLTKRRDAAAIAAAAFAFAPYRIAHWSHLQMLWTAWMAFGLACLHRYVDSNDRRWLGWFGACWVLNALSNGYYLAFFPVLAAGWTLWFARNGRQRLAILAAAVVATLPLVPVLAGYQARQSALGLHRTIGEAQAFSADLTSIWISSPRAWIAQAWTRSAPVEWTLYPGLAVMFAVLAGVMVSRRGAAHAGRPAAWRLVLAAFAALSIVLAIAAAASGGWELHIGAIRWTMHRPSRLVTAALVLGGAAALGSRRLAAARRERSPLAFYVLAAAGSFVLATGPSMRAFGREVFYRAPYSWLMALPGGDSLRVPARWGMPMALCLGAAAAVAFARMREGRRERARLGRVSKPFLRAIDSRLASPLLCVAIVAEGVAIVPVAPVSPSPVVPSNAAAGAPVLELPANGDIARDFIAMSHAMTHGRPLVNGQSGYEPPHYPALQAGLQSMDDGVLDALRRHATIDVFIDPSRELARETGAWIARQPRAHQLSSHWFELPASPPAVPNADAPALRRVRPHSATSRRLSGSPLAMWDDDLTTRWQTDGAQQPGDALTLDLGADEDVARVSLAIAVWIKDYPRGLEISIASSPGGPGAPGVLVWTGRVLGALVDGALASPRRAPFDIDLPANGPRGRYLTLKALDGDAEFKWSIAELAVFVR